MDKTSAIRLLEAFGLNPKMEANKRGYVETCCPFAAWKHEGGSDSSPSFGIKIVEGGVSMAFCFSCKSGGPSRDWVSELQLLGYGAEDWHTVFKVLDDEDEGISIPTYSLEDEEEETGPKFYPFSEEWLSSFLVAKYSPSCYNYLDTRGITIAQADEWDLRWDGVRTRLCFPFRDRKGRLAGMTGRAIYDGNNPKYLQYTYNKNTNPSHFFGEHGIDADLPVVITEGPTDAMRVSLVYPNVLALNGTHVTQERLDRLDDFFEIVLLLDEDKAGLEASKKIKWWGHKTKVISSPSLPQGLDPDKLHPNIIREILEPFVPHTEFTPLT